MNKIERRKDILHYVDVEKFTKKALISYFEKWKNEVESYPAFYYIFVNKLYHHIINGPVILFPSRNEKIRFLNNSEYIFVNQKSKKDLQKFIDQNKFYCVILSEEGEKYYQQYLKNFSEICSLCNKCVSRIRVCKNICLYYPKCLIRGPLCHYYHFQDIHKRTPLNCFIDINLIIMSQLDLWKKYKNNRLHFAGIYSGFVEGDRPYVLIKVLKGLPDFVVNEYHGIEREDDKYLYKFYLPVCKKGEYVICPFGFRKCR